MKSKRTEQVAQIMIRGRRTTFHPRHDYGEFLPLFCMDAYFRPYDMIDWNKGLDNILIRKESRYLTQPAYEICEIRRITISQKLLLV